MSLPLAARRMLPALPLAAALGLIAGCSRVPKASADPSTVRLVGARIGGFDPARAGDAASAAVYARLYEGLLQYDPDARPYRLIPGLAESLPEVSADGLEYVFRLRADVRFQDDPCFAATGGVGRQVVAEDFVYSIKRVADPFTASSGWWAFDDRLEDLDEFRAAAAAAGRADYDRPVAGLRADDARTLRLRLKRPYPQLPWVMAMHYAYAVPREAVEAYGEEFGRHPVGTGPYRLAAWRPNYRMEFVRNPSWAAAGRAEAEEGRPAIARLVAYVVHDPTTQWLLFLQGRLDLIGVGRDQWDAVFDETGALRETLRRRGIEAERLDTLEIQYIGFNMDDPILGPNRALRQALSWAFDGEAWARFHGGRVRRPSSPLPEDIAGDPGAPPCAIGFDLDRARALLREAGYPEGRDPRTRRRLQLTLEVADADRPEIRQSTELFIQFMDRLGVVVRPSYNNRPTFFQKLARRQAQMFRLSWVADYPDAQNFLQLFYGPNASPGPNRANYANPDYDRLYERMREMPDGPERTALCARLVAIVVEDAPWLLVGRPSEVVLRHARLEGYRPHAFPYGMEKYWRLGDDGP
jgi:ABC-type transport system substrate-binding protein